VYGTREQRSYGVSAELGNRRSRKRFVELCLYSLAARSLSARETASDAVHLLVLPSEKAAAWIKSKLPSPPNSESLTRDRPPPAPPSLPSSPVLRPILPVSQSPATAAHQIQQEDSGASLGVIDLEEYRPIDPEEGEIVTTSKQLAAIGNSVRQQYQLPRPPISFNSVDPTLEKSFAGSTFSAPSRCPVASASIDYRFPIVSPSISFPLESTPPPRLSDRTNFSRPLPVPPLLPHPPRIPPANTSHTLLIVNLPLYGTSESLEFLTNFAYFVETFTIPDRNQTVGLVQVDSAEEASTLKKQWNGYAVNGAKVKVVHGEKGLKGKEAVDYYFKNEDEIARAFTRDTGKRRRYG